MCCRDVSKWAPCVLRPCSVWRPAVVVCGLAYACMHACNTSWLLSVPCAVCYPPSFAFHSAPDPNKLNKLTYSTRCAARSISHTYLRVACPLRPACGSTRPSARNSTLSRTVTRCGLGAQMLLCRCQCCGAVVAVVLSGSGRGWLRVCECTTTWLRVCERVCVEGPFLIATSWGSWLVASSLVSR